MENLDFTGMEVDEALRVYQTCFILPVSLLLSIFQLHELLYAEKAFVQVMVVAWIGRRLVSVGHYHSKQIFLSFHWPRAHHVTCK